MNGQDNSSIFQNTVVDGPLGGDPFSGVVGPGAQPKRSFHGIAYAAAVAGLVPIFGWIFGLCALIHGVMHGRERGTMLTKVAAGCLGVSLLITYFTPAPKQKMTRLRSGTSIGLQGKGVMHPFKGQTAMLIEYHTNIDIDDEASVRVEARQAWLLFAKDADRSGFNTAVLMVSPVPKRRFIQISKTVNVVFNKERGHGWHMQLRPGEKEPPRRTRRAPVVAH